MRLFIAITLPETVRDALHAAAAPLRATGAPVKWVAPDGIHVTLKFLGDVELAAEPAIVTALDGITEPRRPFPLAIGGFGVFPSRARPRVVWAGCESAPPLELLQHDVERRMADLDFPLEGRPFRPHLTLGRVRKGEERRAAAVAARLDDVAFETTVEVDAVTLIQSTLSPRGARYTTRHAAALGGAG